MRKYQKYKETEVKGIPAIPKEWVINKIKFVSKTIAGGTPDTKNIQFWENGTIPWLPSGKVHDCNIYEEDADTFITELGLKGSAAKLIPTNSILIALTGATCANIAHLHFSATANQSVIAMPGSKKIENRYLFYCLLGIREQILINKTGGAQSGINDGDIKNTQIPYPSLPEQHAIVRFLDYKTGQIDSFIANRQKQIDLLKEQKAGIINKAVTKGINPNAKMKDSGIEWIGDVPEHWKKMRLKNISRRITNGFVGSTSDILKETGVRYIQALHVKQNTIIFSQPYYVSETWSNEHPRSILKKGDLVITQTGAMTGDVGLVPIEFEGCNCHALIIVKPNIKKVIPEFILFILSSHFGKSLLESIRTGSMHPHLNSTIVCDINISLPEDLLEQKSILEFIKSETSTIDSLISKYQKQIDLMQEYRTSLISQAVTGKIDVREWQPKKQQTR